MPDDLCTVTVTMPYRMAKPLLELAVDVTMGNADMMADVKAAQVGARVPSLSMISTQLSAVCSQCGGRGSVAVSLMAGDGPDQPPFFKTFKCGACGGSGCGVVPGARLLPLGQHVECK